ncbi:MAG: hypothetical protein WKG06_16465 [Segetibacter sp.]
MTVPRDLSIQKVGDKFLVASKPVGELNAIAQKTVTLTNIDATNFNLTAKTGKLVGPARLHLTSDKIENFSFTFSNNKGERLIGGYDKGTNAHL